MCHCSRHIIPDTSLHVTSFNCQAYPTLRNGGWVATRLMKLYFKLQCTSESVISGEPFRTAQSLSLYSPGMALAWVRSGWMMLAVLGLNHVCSPAQTGELGLTTVPILKMWQFPVLAFVSLALTAATSTLHCPVSLAHGCKHAVPHSAGTIYYIDIAI